MSDNQAVCDAPVQVQQPKTPSLHGVKKRFARKLHWLSIILAPILLIALTISTRYISHPRALDVLHDNDWEALRDWSSHKRHPGNDDLTVAPSADATATSSSTFIFESATTTSATEQELPTIPSEAILPTPFPQPWDSDIGQSYDSASCFNFIANMTAAKEFRTCRPFSLLMTTSSVLTKAQSNLTLSNSIIWGTCNPPPGYDACVSSMASFATQLQDRCSVDLSKNNTVAMEALLGVQSYSIMYNAGCLSDPSTNVYCYTSAIANSNPADLYTYQLPGGLPLPKSATPSCSACSKSLMSVYADALDSQPELEGLKETYANAEQRMEVVCGQGFARAASLNSVPRTLGNAYNMWSIFLISGVLLSLFCS